MSAEYHRQNNAEPEYIRSNHTRLELRDGRMLIVGGTNRERERKWRKILYSSGITSDRYDEMIRRRYPL